MLANYVLPGLIALAAAQAPPPPVLLTASKSGVIPIPPTPFPGVETEEGAIIDQGPAIPGFTGPGGNATVQSNLPAATYMATLPSTNFDDLTGSTITGSITGTSQANGQGVTFSIDFKGFPSVAQYGPFLYHIHGMPVPADGNCTATLGHLDPTNRGEYHPCEVAAPQTCQAGDLAGKHGMIMGTSFTATYMEPYLSTQPGSPYFFGDKSIVIHSMNTTRLTCANFKMVGSNGTASAGGSASASAGGSASATAGASGTASGTASGAATAPGTTFTGAAANLWNGKDSLMGGAVGLAAALLL